MLSKWLNLRKRRICVSAGLNRRTDCVYQYTKRLWRLRPTKRRQRFFQPANFGSAHATHELQVRFVCLDVFGLPISCLKGHRDICYSTTCKLEMATRTELSRDHKNNGRWLDRILKKNPPLCFLAHKRKKNIRSKRSRVRNTELRHSFCKKKWWGKVGSQAPVKTTPSQISSPPNHTSWWIPLRWPKRAIYIPRIMSFVTF